MGIIAEDIPGCELSERELELPEAVEQYRNQIADIKHQIELQSKLSELKSS